MQDIFIALIKEIIVISVWVVSVSAKFGNRHVSSVYTLTCVHTDVFVRVCIVCGLLFILASYS